MREMGILRIIQLKKSLFHDGHSKTVANILKKNN